MHRFFLRLSQLFAYLGGVVLCIVIVLTFISILGRNLGSFHWIIDFLVKGSFEISGGLMAFVIFAFFPITQIAAGHAIVDILTSSFSDGMNRFLMVVADALYAGAMLVISYQLFQGMLRKLRAEEITLFLQYPLWWGYALALVAACAASLVALYVAYIRIREAMGGRAILAAQGAEH